MALFEHPVTPPRRAAEQSVELAVGHRQSGTVFEIFEIETEGTIRLDIDQPLADNLLITRLSVGGKAHQFVLA
jgi:hypothetical protein